MHLHLLTPIPSQNTKEIITQYRMIFGKSRILTILRGHTLQVDVFIDQINNSILYKHPDMREVFTYKCQCQKYH